MSLREFEWRALRDIILNRPLNSLHPPGNARGQVRLQLPTTAWKSPPEKAVYGQSGAGNMGGQLKPCRIRGTPQGTLAEYLGEPPDDAPLGMSKQPSLQERPRLIGTNWQRGPIREHPALQLICRSRERNTRRRVPRPFGAGTSNGELKGDAMPDEYWTQVAKDRDQRKRAAQYHAALRLRKKHPNAKRNRRRWPKGSIEVSRALDYLGIPNFREFVIVLPCSTFFQADFALTDDKVFVEIDGPEHDQLRDSRRMERINAIPRYSDWTWIRLTQDECFDTAGLYCTFGKFARNLEFLK